MTTVHEAPGDARPEEGLVDGGQDTGVTVEETVSQEPGGQITMSRRRALALLGGGGLAVGIAAGGGTWWATRNNSAPVAPRTHPTGGQSGQAGEYDRGLPDTPAEISIDGTNPRHIHNVFMGDPVLQGRVRRFLGSEDIRPREPGTDMRYPWLQVSTGGGHLTVTMRPAGFETAPGERLPSWAQVQQQPGFDASRWSQFEGGSVVSFNDQYPRGRTIAGITGWANIGTPDERMFTVETNGVGHLTAMSPEARRAEFSAVTSAFLGARAIG
jgi:hypothetical protein